MTIYLDVVLLENLCMNYIILFATSYIMKIKTKQWRLIISSFVRRDICCSCISRHITILLKFNN
jgi:uncharacterized membrane protein